MQIQTAFKHGTRNSRTSITVGSRALGPLGWPSYNAEYLGGDVTHLEQTSKQRNEQTSKHLVLSLSPARPEQCKIVPPAVGAESLDLHLRNPSKSFLLAPSGTHRSPSSWLLLETQLCALGPLERPSCSAFVLRGGMTHPKQTNKQTNK